MPHRRRQAFSGVPQALHASLGLKVRLRASKVQFLAAHLHLQRLAACSECSDPGYGSPRDLLRSTAAFWHSDSSFFRELKVGKVDHLGGTQHVYLLCLGLTGCCTACCIMFRTEVDTYLKQDRRREKETWRRLQFRKPHIFYERAAHSYAPRRHSSWLGFECRRHITRHTC